MEQVSPEGQRIFSEQQAEKLKQEVLETALKDRPEIVGIHLEETRTLVSSGLEMIQAFEEATNKAHPVIYTDTDVVYIDSGPGPYSYKMLEEGKTDLDDVAYHKYPWSRKMDRARIRAAYVLAGMIAAKRIEEQTDVKKSPHDLTKKDYEDYVPYLMYTATDWQNAHIRRVLKLQKASGRFKIPDNKLIMYEEFINRQGERKPIIHTEDQIEGLQFPLGPDGNPPRRVAIVSHPAHLMRIMHILGKYPNSIPEGTILQAFPVPTPIAAVREYSRDELIGTIVAVFGKDRASLTPYNKYQL